VVKVQTYVQLSLLRLRLFTHFVPLLLTIEEHLLAVEDHFEEVHPRWADFGVGVKTEADNVREALGARGRDGRTEVLFRRLDDDLNDLLDPQLFIFLTFPF
jgi:hypothetical protein